MLLLMSTRPRRYQQNMGSMLAPPLRAEHSLGPLVPHRVTVQGNSWKESSTDIAIAGVGWLGIGTSGSAGFDVWTHDGEHHAGRFIFPVLWTCSYNHLAWKPYDGRQH